MLCRYYLGCMDQRWYDTEWCAFEGIMRWVDKLWLDKPETEIPDSEENSDEAHFREYGWTDRSYRIGRVKRVRRKYAKVAGIPIAVDKEFFKPKNPTEDKTTEEKAESLAEEKDPEATAEEGKPKPTTGEEKDPEATAEEEKDPEATAEEDKPKPTTGED